MNYKLALVLTMPFLLSFQLLNTEERLTHKWKDLLSAHKIPLRTQSFCIDDGQKIFGENIHQKMKPASVSKLYTTFWALHNLGPDFQFQTHFVLEDNTLYIKGGGDPFFVTENIFFVISTLNQMGITKLENIIVHNGFAYNWTKNSNSIIKSFQNVFNTHSWDQSMKNTFKDMNNTLRLNDLNKMDELKFSVNKVEFATFQSVVPSFVHYSSPIKHHLKQVNMFSNNFYSDEIFYFLGGKQSFEDFILRELDETPENIRFETGSGLGSNYTTCAITLKLLSKLESIINQYNDKTYDYISMSGVDQGTLRSRFRGEGAKSVIAKTGTLRDTTSLAGYVGLESYKFVIFNHGYNLASQRLIQDELVQELIHTYKPAPLEDYQAPNYVSILESSIILQ